MSKIICSNLHIRSQKMSIKNLDNMILSYLAENNSASPDALAEAFDVSPSTIRRRFCELQDKGLIQRARGCAKLRQDNNFTQSFTFRKHQNSLEKKRIALEAIKLIKNGDVIFLDGSSSAYFIAQYLAQYDNIKVFTNGIDTLSLLAQNNVKAYSTGGMVHKDDKSILVGTFAERLIDSIHADICFFSAHTVDKDGNVWDVYEDENSVLNHMIDHSGKSVFLCDNSKIGHTAAFSIGKVDDFDYMVCDVDVTNKIKTGRCNVIICPSI